MQALALHACSEFYLLVRTVPREPQADVGAGSWEGRFFFLQNKLLQNIPRPPSVVNLEMNSRADRRCQDGEHRLKAGDAEPLERSVSLDGCRRR